MALPWLPATLCLLLAACGGGEPAGTPQAAANPAHIEETAAGAPLADLRVDYAALSGAALAQDEGDAALDAMQAELARSREAYFGADEAAYFLAYRLHDTRELTLSAEAGSLRQDSEAIGDTPFLYVQPPEDFSRMMLFSRRNASELPSAYLVPSLLFEELSASEDSRQVRRLPLLPKPSASSTAQ